MFNMRGFSAANSLFVDGVRDDGLIARDVYNLEQIEVFSGPTGSDVGRMNAAGYINLETKAPNLEAAQARHAQLRRRRNRCERRSTSTSRFTSVRVADVLGQRRHSRQRAVAGRRHRRSRLHRAREQVDRAVDRVRPEHADPRQPQRPGHAAGQPRRLRPARGRCLPTVRSPPAASLRRRPSIRTNYYGSPDYDYDKVSQDNVMLRAEHDFSPAVTLRNQTRYNTTQRAKRSSRASPIRRPTTRRRISSP